MSFKPEQPVYFTYHENLRFAGVIEGSPSYELGLRALEDRTISAHRAGEPLEIAYVCRTGVRFTHTVDTPRHPGETYSLDISLHQSASMIVLTIEGTE